MTTTGMLTAALADRYQIQPRDPALKGGLGARSADVLKDRPPVPFRAAAAHRAAPSRAFTPGTPSGAGATP